jgi:hypothetical protein
MSSFGDNIGGRLGFRGVAMIRIKRSPMAQEIARWATFSYEFALTLIAVGLVVAIIFAVLSPEHLAQQLLTVVFLGIIPALFTYLIGFMAYWALKGASAIYDPALLALGQTSHVLTNIAVIGLRSLVVPATKLLLRWANQLASNFFLACRSAVAPLLNGVGPGSLARHASKRRSAK